MASAFLGLLLVSTALPGVALSAADADPAGDAAEEEASTENDDGVVMPLSANPANTRINGMELFAYVADGETLDVAMERVAGTAAAGEVTVEGPGTGPLTCTIPAGGTPPCAWDGLAGDPGIWRIELVADSVGSHFVWEIDVMDEGSSVDGRVWSEVYDMRQGGGAEWDADLTVWFQSELGYLYEAVYHDFNGVHSLIYADATGVAFDGTCASAYQSWDDPASPFSDPDLWVPPAGACGDLFKMFFEAPAADLPTSALRWDGTSDWIVPPAVQPEVTGVTYTPDSPTVRSGTIAYDVTNFTGQLEVQIDTDGDGIFDLTIPGFAADGAGSVTWDGLDGDGQPVSAFEDLHIRVAITRTGEIHFSNWDVEIRSGIEVTRLNGPDAGDTTIYWDDTGLRTQDRACVTPVLDGTAGVDSTGGVHGWPCRDNANDGVGGSWGDMRFIDNWTYVAIDDESEDVVVPAFELTAWECTPDGILTQDIDPSNMHFIDLVTGESLAGPQFEDRALNAAAYNVVDDFLYAMDNTIVGPDGARRGLVRIGADGSVEELGMPSHPELDPSHSWPVGDIDNNGHYWIANSVGANVAARWYQIDLNPGPTFLEVLDWGLVAGNPEGIPAGVWVGSGDWAWVPGGGDNLWRVMRNNATGNWHLVAFDMVDGTHRDMGQLPPLDAQGPSTFGAAYADEQFLYVSNNTSGAIYRVDVQAGTASFFTDGPPSGNNDGARCAVAPISTDYGDAPASYRTLLDDDGPRHGLRGYDPDTATASLMLGSQVSHETDGQPSTGADADTFDDGVTDPIVLNQGEPIEVEVSVTNLTDDEATVVGWIDVAGTGTFDPGDRSNVEVVPAGFEGTVTLTFPPGATTQDTYARFRVFGGVEDDPSPVGAARSGEVEDYLVLAGRVHYEKTVDPDDVAELQPGDTFTYTVTASNLGSVPLTDLSFTDDLSDVLDDATFVPGSLTWNLGTATFDAVAEEVAWTGDLAVGAVATVSFQVTIDDPPTGDAILFNGVVGDGPGSNCTDDPSTDPACFTEVPQPQISGAKSSDATDPVVAGDTVTYSFTVTNTGPAPAQNAVVHDDLSGVLDDAVYNDDAAASDGNVTFDAANQRLVWNGPLAAAGDPGDSATVTYSVTVNPAGEMGDGVLQNALILSGCPNPPVFDPDDPDFDPDCVVVDPIEAWTAVKTVDPGGIVVPGDVVTYTVEVTNTGGVDLAGLSLSDDLSDVLDDAAYNGDADTNVGTVEFEPPDELVWTGDLDVGTSATITYTVTVNAADQLGDGILINAISGSPNCPDPAVTDPDDPDYDPDCVPPPPMVEAWRAVKTSDAAGAAVEAGDVVAYTITISNLGAVPLTGCDGPCVTVTDDLSGVLDDATYNGDASATAGAVSLTQPVLTWTGELDVAAEVVVTYSVTIDPPGSGGDGVLTNAIVGSPNCPDPAITDPDHPDHDPDCVPVPPLVREWIGVKSSDAVSPVGPGDVVEFTITVTNTGGVALTGLDAVTFTDDLSDVLDDAAYNGDVTVESGPGTVAFVAPDTIEWSGELEVGAVAIVTYSVTVNDADDLGDGQLRNAIAGPSNCPETPVFDPDDPNFDPDCVEALDVAATTVVKTSDGPQQVEAGDTVEYTVVVTNTGGVDLSGEDAATFTDDLSGVLDDAAYNDDAAANIGSVTYTEPDLVWTGDLAVGQVATVTYSVTVDDPITGDFALTNAVTGGQCPAPAVTDPDAPDFDPDCVTIDLLPGIHYHKAIFGTPVDELGPGDTYTYMVTVTNTGQVDLVDQWFEDDLAEVLDDAAYNGDADTNIGTVSYGEPILRWEGDLAVGEVATVTYTVTIDDPVTGDGILRNRVVGEGNCAQGSDDPDCFTVFPESVVVVTKEKVSPTEPAPGDTVTYRIEAHNRGGGTAEQELIVDDLSGLLDDATYNDDVEVTAGTAVHDEPLLSWRVDIAPGSTVAMVYTVTVHDVDDLGDGRLVNTVTGGITCPPGGDDPSCGTDDGVHAVRYDKTIIDPADGHAEGGDTVTYQVTVTNLGGAPLDGLSFTDDLAAVLEHATYLDDASADVGSVDYEAPVLTWTGGLAPAEQATITYSVVLDDDAPAATALRNVVVGLGPGSNCLPNPGDPVACTAVLDVVEAAEAVEQPAPPSRLPLTGGDVLRLLVGAMLMAATGGLLLSRRRRAVVPAARVPR